MTSLILIRSSAESHALQYYPDMMYKEMIYHEKMFYESYVEDTFKFINLNSKQLNYDTESSDYRHRVSMKFDNEFDYLKFTSFVQFFKNSGVKVPMAFRKSKSLRRDNLELELLKLINYIVKDGKRYKIMKYFSQASNNLINSEYYKAHNLTDLYSWRFIYLYTQNMEIKGRAYYGVNIYEEYKSSYNHHINHYFKKNLTDVTENDLLLNNFRKLLPIFSLYIYKVDKNIYKNTRGKSGKFTFLWKYVARYKRPLWVMYWLYKEIKIQQSKSFVSRIENILVNLIRNPQQLWAWKIRKFSLIYVYRNARTTLAESYVTVTK